MTEKREESGGFYQVNYPGLVAGIALLILPFLDFWWFFVLGSDAVYIALSPFQVYVESFGNEITSPLLTSLNLGLRLVILYYGAILLAGSLIRAREDRRSISDILVRVSARKFLWLVILFVVSVAVSDFVINQAFSLMGVEAQVPYFTGDTVIPFHMSGLSLTVPVTQGFTDVFIIAIIVAIISLVAYFYQRHVTLEKTEKGTRFRLLRAEGPAAVPAAKAPAETEARGR
jgi:hypothetical protein